MTSRLSFKRFVTKKRCLSFILFLILALIPFYGSSQKTKNIIVEEGEYKIWKKGSIIAEKLIIRGELTIADRADMDITVFQVIIDGGTLNIGSTEKPFEHRLNLLFRKSRNGGLAGIVIENKGSISMHGTSRDSVLTSFPEDANPEKLKSIDRNVSMKTSDTETDAMVYIEDADEVVLSGILFDGLGSNTEPALHWKGTTLAESQVSNSIFIHSKGEDIFLDETSVKIANNHFISDHGSSIICSPSRATVNNRLESNLIDNRSGKGTYAMAIYNPFQSIRNNHIITTHETNGVGLLSPGLRDGILKNETQAAMVLEKNSLLHIDETAGSNKTKNSVTGLKIDAFVHTGIWRMKENKIANFQYGCMISSRNTVLDGFHLIDNTVGIVPGTAYVQNTKIVNRKGVNKKGTKAIWVTDSHGTSAPKVSNMTIENYGVGIHFDGAVEPENYFEKINFLGTPPVGFDAMHPFSAIKVKDGSFTAKKTDGERQQAHHNGMEDSRHASMDRNQFANMGHTQHIGMKHGLHDEHASLHTPRKQASGYYLFPKESMLVSEQSTSFENNSDIHISEISNFGNLTISTGFGLLDPIHEHGGELQKIKVRNKHTAKSLAFGNSSNRHEVFLAANNDYVIDLGENERCFYDLSFEWEAPPKSWILIEVPYTYENAYGMRSFGNLISPSGNMEELRRKKVTSYFVDTKNGKVFIKLFGKHHRDELVLYSADVLTEITVDAKKIPVGIRKDDKQNSVELSFGIPAKTSAKIALLDYNGNIVESLFNGLSTNKNTTVIVDMDKYDVANEVYLYSLTVGEETHRGPVHAYEYRIVQTSVSAQ